MTYDVWKILHACLKNKALVKLYGLNLAPGRLVGLHSVKYLSIYFPFAVAVSKPYMEMSCKFQANPFMVSRDISV